MLESGVLEEAGGLLLSKVLVGLGRILATYCRLFTLYQICSEIRCLYF
jgi:hypothetical protein